MFFNEQRNKVTGPEKTVAYEQLCICKSFVKTVLLSLCRISLQSGATNENSTVFL